ncbi:hypothetical protein E1301_Tti017307 [Triplophysa tibetana]|uniref:Ig-like domain-containing protein n=1 Tax=Triplophysa tibetana TaxID=1572043 RepID=A0A5A9P955_9TELE|nr:hypothetical protein E1301_Tti017307 [Triplophysa tibetana]
MSVQTMFFVIYLLVWIKLPLAVSLSVKVPSRPIAVARGATASLPCEFTPDPELSKLVITWQRVDDNRVVHSYYYQQDQLGRQSSDYRNRTELNHRQIVEGNATLAISNFGQEDKGEYLCVVSNSLESERGVVRLIYVDKGLYFLSSSYVTKNPAFNITFTLKNPAVHQEMQRHVIFSKDGNTGIQISVVSLGILCFAFMCSTAVLLWLHCQNKKNQLHDMELPNSNNHYK